MDSKNSSACMRSMISSMVIKLPTMTCEIKNINYNLSKNGIMITPGKYRIVTHEDLTMLRDLKVLTLS